jgi:hypothetical protein
VFFLIESANLRSGTPIPLCFFIREILLSEFGMKKRRPRHQRLAQNDNFGRLTKACYSVSLQEWNFSPSVTMHDFCKPRNDFWPEPTKFLTALQSFSFRDTALEQAHIIQRSTPRVNLFRRLAHTATMAEEQHEWVPIIVIDPAGSGGVRIQYRQ